MAQKSDEKIFNKRTEHKLNFDNLIRVAWFVGKLTQIIKYVKLFRCQIFVHYRTDEVMLVSHGQTAFSVFP